MFDRHDSLRGESALFSHLHAGTTSRDRDTVRPQFLAGSWSRQKEGEDLRDAPYHGLRAGDAVIYNGVFHRNAQSEDFI